MKSSEYLQELRAYCDRNLPADEVLSAVLSVMLARTSLTVSRELGDKLEARHDLHISQFDVLATLSRLDRPDGVPLHELCAQMAAKPPSMTHRVGQLLEKELVERLVCPADRRSWHIRLTSKGKQFYEKVAKDQQEEVAAIMKVLDDQDKEILLGLLTKLLDGVEKTD